MTENELAHLVEKIVQTVLERLKIDPALKAYFKSDTFTPSQPGAKSEPAKVTDDSVMSTNQHLITEHDMKRWHKSGITELHVNEKSIFTPSAMDVARDKKIKVINKA